MLDKKVLEYVRAVANNKSFSKASEELYIAQPYLSRYIKRLEKELGVELFDRRKLPVTPTAEGERFLEYLEMFEKLQDDMYKEFSLMSNRKNKLRIGTLPYLGAYILQRIITDYKNIDNNTSIYINEYSVKYIEKALINGEINLFFTNLPPKSDKIKYKVIKPDPIILVGVMNDKLEKKYDLSNNNVSNPINLELSEFKDETFVLLQSWQNMRIITDRLFKMYNFIPKKIIETSSVSNALNLINAGFGVTFICESAIRNTIFNFPAVYFALKETDNISSIIISYLENSNDGIVANFINSAFNTLNSINI